MNLRTFIISAELFWGYKCQVDLDKVENLDDICKYVIKQLTNDLLSKNLVVLEEILNNKRGHPKLDFHVHDVEFGDILLSDPDKEFYVCSH
jgi:hypothetical protein